MLEARCLVFFREGGHGELHPLCSVVIPAFNSEKFIECCVMSALNQTLKNIEVIVVDDCSIDSTADIVTRLSKIDPRVILIKNTANCGTAVSRNAGVSAASSEWIAFLDADDIWFPYKLEAQFKQQRRTGADIVYTAAFCIDSEGESLNRTITVPAEVSYRDMLKGNDIICSSALVKRELLVQYPMQTRKLHEDYIFWLQILKSGSRAVGINTPYTLYRLHSKSRTANKLYSIVRTGKTYEYLGISFVKRTYYLVSNIIHGIKRYFL